MNSYNTNQNLRVKYLQTLVNMNNESPTPGVFNHFTATGSGKRTGYRRNFYASNPERFYSNIDLHDHNWMTLNTLNADVKGTHRRRDVDVANLMSNYLDVDCLQANVNPDDFIHKFNNYLKQSHHSRIFDVLKPSMEQRSGHGVYLVYLYKHPVSLGNLSPKDKQRQLKHWKVTERSLAMHLNCLTRRWYGKSLADIKSTNPARILRMPNTINVKYQDPKQKFTKPAPSYISVLTGKRYDYNKFTNYVEKNYTPLFDKKYRQQSTTEPLHTDRNPAGNFWSKISTAQEENADPHKRSQLNLSNIKTSRYDYGTYHPHYGRSKKPWLHYNFTALDYLKDHGISWKYDDGGKNIKIFKQPGVNSNGGDLSSLTLTQKENKVWNRKTHEYVEDPNHSYTQIARPSNRWGNVLNKKNVNGKKLDSLTEVIMLHDKISDIHHAHQIRDLWKKHYATEGHTKSEFPWQKYGVGNGASHQNSVVQNDETIASSSQDTKLSAKDLYDMSFKGKILRKYWGNKKYNVKKFNSIEQQYQDDHNGNDLPNYDQLLNKLKIQNPNNYLKDDVIDNNIARNYLIHRRGLSASLVNAQIKAGNIRGIKGYKYHPAKLDPKTGRRMKTADGRNIRDYNKWAYKSPKVEFVQRRPRNSFDAHLAHRISPKANNSIYHDIKLQLHPKYSPKVGEQIEVPCGADYIGLQKTNDTYTDKNGQSHQIYNTEMIDKNHTGNFKKNKLVDAAGDHNYGFNVKTGTGTKNLYVFEAPIDALSHLDMQVKYYKQLKKTQPNNTKALQKAKSAFQDSTYLSLSGAGGKTKSIQHFINAQYAQGNEYSNVICSFDNDAPGYSAAQQVMSEFGNRKAYSTNNKSNLKNVSADIPISNNRKPGHLTDRIDANDKHSTFNKDWNDMSQSNTFKHQHFSKPAVHMNSAEYAQDNINQMYNEMEDVDKLYSKQHPQENVSAETDAQKADVYIQTSNKIQSNYKAGKEKIDGKNPRIDMMNKAVNSMSKPGKAMFKKYMDYVGTYLSTNEMSAYSTRAFQNHYHHPNSYLQNLGVKDALNQKYNVPILHQKINNVMDSMSSNKSRELFATSLKSRANILKRSVYHHFHGTMVGRKEYKNMHGKWPRPEYTSDKLTAQFQDDLDRKQEFEGLDNLRFQHNDDYKKLHDTLAEYKKTYENTANPNAHIRLQAYKTLIGASDYAGIKLHQNGIYSTYTFGDLQKKKEYMPDVNRINAINETTNNELSKKFSHKSNYKKSFSIPKSVNKNHQKAYASIIRDIGREDFFSKQHNDKKYQSYSHDAHRQFNKLSSDEQDKVVHYAHISSSKQKDNNAYLASQYLKKYNSYHHSPKWQRNFMGSLSNHPHNHSHYRYHSAGNNYHPQHHEKSQPTNQQKFQQKKRTNYRKLFMKQLHR